MTSHLNVAVRGLVVLAAVVGLCQIGATLAAFSATTDTNGSTFTSAVTFGGGCPAANLTPLWLTGFEHGGSILANGGGIFDVLTGAPTADSAVKNNGVYSLKVLDASAAAAINGAKTTTATSSFVTRFAIRLNSLPVSNVTELARVKAAAGNHLQLGYDAAAQKLRLALGTTATPVATVTAATTISAGSWYVIDLRLDTSTTTRTGAWQISGVAQANVTNTEAASTANELRFGSTLVADLFTANYDDVKVTAAAADYPLPYARILKLSPNGFGTHSNFNQFFHSTMGSAALAGDWALLDDVPVRGTGIPSLSDGISQNTTGTGSYLAVTFADAAETCIKSVWALASGYANQGPGQSKTVIVDGTTERLVYDGSWPASTTQDVRSAAILPVSQPWTTATLNALFARFGYAADGSKQPSINGLMLEYEVGEP